MFCQYSICDILFACHTILRSAAKKHVTLRFLLNPVEIRPSPEDSSRVGSVVCEMTRLEGEPGKQRAVGTGQTEEIPADLVSFFTIIVQNANFVA